MVLQREHGPGTTPITRRTIELHRFVPRSKAMDYVRAGWVPLRSLVGTHHDFKVHLMWRCCCEAAIEPEPSSNHNARAVNRALQRAAREAEFKSRRRRF